MQKMEVKIWMVALLAAALSVAVGCSTAAGPASAKGEKPATWQFHDITGIELVQQYAVVPQPKDVLIVDSRPHKPMYINGHIPTAISMPFSQFDKMTDKLPKDKKTLLIFYCGGPT